MSKINPLRSALCGNRAVYNFTKVNGLAITCLMAGYKLLEWQERSGLVFNEERIMQEEKQAYKGIQKAMRD